jgi:hypothetical protein
MQPLVVFLSHRKQTTENVFASTCEGGLRRLFQNPNFKKDFSTDELTGFIRGLEFPPRGTTAKMGGKLLPGSDAKTTAGIEKLRDAISAELEGIG